MRSMTPWTRLSLLATARLLLIATLWAIAMATAEAADPYKLAVSDKITVHVVEWQSSGAAFEDWTAVSGDYLVGPDGTISFPFLGEVPAAGQTAADLGKALGSGLQTTLGLTDAPNVTVGITTFGPVYVAGDVQTPGAYAYLPDLDVIKAVSLAGGVRRGPADATSQSNRDLINLQGDYDVMRDQRIRLLVKRAGLDAVLARQDSITVPASIKDAAATPGLVAIQTAVLKAGDDEIKAQTASLASQKDLLSKSLDSLAQKRQTTSDQLTAAQDRLAKVQSLADNGLAISDRVVTMQSNVADLEGRLLDIDAAELKARQDISTADTQSAKLLSDQFIQTSQDRQDVDSQIAQVELKMATQEKLIADAIALGATPTDQTVSFSYTILRGGSQMPATDTDALRPGDVVMVKMNVSP